MTFIEKAHQAYHNIGHKLTDPLLGKPEAEGPDGDAAWKAREEQAAAGLPTQVRAAQDGEANAQDALSSYNPKHSPPDPADASSFHATQPTVEFHDVPRTYARPGEDDLREEEALREGGTAGDDSGF